MSKQQDQTSGQQLWRQIFGPLSKNHAAAVMDPSYDRDEVTPHRHRAMRAAGWSEDAIAVMDAITAERLASAPQTSPGINPHVEAQYAMLADAIEAAMTRLGYNSQERVARGVEPRVGPYAAKTNVIMTDESIVTIGAFLFRYCGLVARAFTRTLRLDPFFWESENYNDERARTLLRSNPDLLAYWSKIFTSFSVSGTNVLAPYHPSRPEEAILMEQVARAMEIFAIAHEYGHHHLDHRQVGTDAHGEEFAADAFALRVSDEVEKYPVVSENPYLLSGAGALILLMSLDTLRSVEAIFGARPRDHDTHPPVAERIARFDAVRLLFPDEHRWLKGFRTASLRIMSVVHAALLETVPTMPAEILTEMREMRAEFEQWKDLKP